MTEKDLYNSLKDRLPEPHWTRIENLAGVGQPDVNCCYKGVEFWMELKIGEPLLRPAQYAWSMRRAKQGGRVFILSVVPEGIGVWRYPHVETIAVGEKLKVTSKPKLFKTILLYKEIINYLIS